MYSEKSEVGYFFGGGGGTVVLILSNRNNNIIDSSFTILGTKWVLSLY